MRQTKAASELTKRLDSDNTRLHKPPSSLYRVCRLGITGRIAILLCLITVLPMFITSYMIEAGRLQAGQNYYLVVPVLIIIMIIPISRVLGYVLLNRDLEKINLFCLQLRQGNFNISFDLGNEKGEEDSLIVLLRNLSWTTRTLATRDRLAQRQIQGAINRCEEMQRAAHTDKLTGLFNRRHLDAMIQPNLTTIPPLCTSIIFIDCDNFKQLNDNHGHAKGDQALVHLSHAIQLSIRQQSDSAFRYGGDEFAIILPGSSEHNAEQVAQRIHAEYRQHQCQETTLSIGISCAIRNTQPYHEQLRDLIEKADQQVYRVKTQGGDGTASKSY